jgi:hypothetical protein
MNAFVHRCTSNSKLAKSCKPNERRERKLLFTLISNSKEMQNMQTASFMSSSFQKATKDSWTHTHIKIIIIKIFNCYALVLITIAQNYFWRKTILVFLPIPLKSLTANCISVLSFVSARKTIFRIEVHLSN